MTPQDENQLSDWNEKLQGKVQIRVILTRDERSGAFDEFSGILSEKAPKIEMIREKSDTEDPPEIKIGNNVSYRAIPLGPELQPFLALLSARADHSAVLPKSVRKSLDQIQTPLQLRLYISPHCPFCPQAVGSLTPLCALNAMVRLNVIDGAMFSEMAASDNIRSVPTLLLESAYQWTGSFKVAEVVSMMANSDPSRLSLSTLENMIKEGQAAKLADIMVDNEILLPSFPDLLTHPYFSTRLGAMVVMEEIAERAPEIARQAVKPLWDRFPSKDASIQGDILYILGLSATPESIPGIKQIIGGDYSGEIKEAAEEALESIRERNSGI